MAHYCVICVDYNIYIVFQFLLHLLWSVDKHVRLHSIIAINVM